MDIYRILHSMSREYTFSSSTHKINFLNHGLKTNIFKNLDKCLNNSWIKKFIIVEITYYLWLAKQILCAFSFLLLGQSPTHIRWPLHLGLEWTPHCGVQDLASWEPREGLDVTYWKCRQMSIFWYESWPVGSGRWKAAGKTYFSSFLSPADHSRVRSLLATFLEKFNT